MPAFKFEIMWSEEQIRQYVEKRIDKHFYLTPSAIALQSFYVGNDGWRFDKLRSLVEDHIRIYKQKILLQ